MGFRIVREGGRGFEFRDFSRYKLLHTDIWSWLDHIRGRVRPDVRHAHANFTEQTRK